MRKPMLYVTTLLSAAFAAGCAVVGPNAPAAQAQVRPTQGSGAKGRVEFRQVAGAVEVVATLSGLSPGAHGFHIHQKGDCSAPDATSAGGHFNPSDKPHGHPGQDPHHAGDMPMLNADAQGNATLKAVLPGLSVNGEASAIVGRAVIVHAAPDDFKTQPTGNSGARVACGVIAAR